jgi:hypothetical protein
MTPGAGRCRGGRLGNLAPCVEGHAFGRPGLLRQGVSFELHNQGSKYVHLAWRSAPHAQLIYLQRPHKRHRDRRLLLIVQPVLLSMVCR